MAKPGPGTPGWTGRMDQLRAGNKDVGRGWAAYHAGMVEDGMRRSEATATLIAFVATTNLRGVIERLIKLKEVERDDDG